MIHSSNMQTFPFHFQCRASWGITNIFLNNMEDYAKRFLGACLDTLFSQDCAQAF